MLSIQFIYKACGVALCSLVLVELMQAPRDCFRVYHEKRFCICEFSVAIAGDADKDSNDSDDTVKEVHKKNHISVKKKRGKSKNYYV